MSACARSRTRDASSNGFDAAFTAASRSANDSGGGTSFDGAEWVAELSIAAFTLADDVGSGVWTASSSKTVDSTVPLTFAIP